MYSRYPSNVENLWEHAEQLEEELSALEAKVDDIIEKIRIETDRSKFKYGTGPSQRAIKALNTKLLETEKAVESKRTECECAHKEFEVALRSLYDVRSKDESKLLSEPKVLRPIIHMSSADRPVKSVTFDGFSAVELDGVQKAKELEQQMNIFDHNSAKADYFVKKCEDRMSVYRKTWFKFYSPMDVKAMTNDYEKLKDHGHQLYIFWQSVPEQYKETFAYQPMMEKILKLMEKMKEICGQFNTLMGKKYLSFNPPPLNPKPFTELTYRR